MLNCAIIGATGFTGIELAKILLNHPHVRIAALTTRQKEGIKIHSLIPSLPNAVDLEVRPFSYAEVTRAADIIFLCLPHTEAIPFAGKLLQAGKVVIDLSADFRLRNKKDYEVWYGVKHTNAALLKKAVYGLPEFYRETIRKADLIANPGCYPTGAILGLGPLLQKNLIDPGAIVIDSKSGVSGAGKKLTPATHFCEVDENFYAYKVNRHQHIPEIEQTLSDLAARDISVTFVPHLLPLQRGILSTLYAKRRKGVKPQAVAQAFSEAYGDEPFVRLKPAGNYPALKDVCGTNYCDIGFEAMADTDRVIVITAIDNLVKGAAGQAVQNMNIRCGFAEEEGLRRL